MVPEDSLMPVNRRSRKAENSREDGAVRVYEDLSYTVHGAHRRVVTAFGQKYGKVPQDVAFTPYRICPIGAHSDHNLGKITGFAIDKGIYIAYGPKQNGVIEIASLQFPRRAQWHVGSVPVHPEGDWADHLRGATIALDKRYPLRTGLCAVIDGELPIGGLRCV